VKAMKKKASIYISILILGMFFFPNFSLALEECFQDGYTVVTINGMLTDRTGAIRNMNTLKEKLGF